MNYPVVIHDASRQLWLTFGNPAGLVTALTIGEVIPALREVEKAVNSKGLYAAGFLSYEAAPAFDTALKVRTDPSGFPLLWFGLYPAPHESACLPKTPSQGPESSPQASESTPPSWVPSINREQYDGALSKLRQYLYDGDTYQVNYSFRLTRPFSGDSWPLFQKLVQAQGAHFSAYVDTGHFTLCSASPELFFRLDGLTLESRPMKGTAARGLTIEDDRNQAQALHESAKNRAENVMIVDMIRNDMGRVAVPGTVDPTRLFNVERYPTLWQMVSTVSAQTHASLSDIMAALFPCASITGAPKPHTMEIIAHEETTPRRIYTGTIGYIAPGRRAQFNVAIRTVLVDRTAGLAEYGTGGGIIWDSESGAEYEECRIKAAILTERQPEFQLLETLLWSKDTSFFLMDRHLDRLAGSAEYFEFPYSRREVINRLESAVSDYFKQHPGPGDLRIRLLLARDGSITVEPLPFDPIPPGRKATVRLAASPVDDTHRFLYHKTTHRMVYEQARAACPGCDDVLLWNKKGELTESTIANIVVELDGRRVTPPVSCGLLPGTFRAERLAHGEIEEAVIRIEDLHRGTRLWLINSVRQWREATLAC